jgi:hypothetical protein
MTKLARIQPNEQLQPIDLIAPGSLGLNLEESGSLLDPQYCVTALNAVIDINGRLGARSGIATQTTTPVAGNLPIKTIFEYNQGNNVYTKLFLWDGGGSTNIANPNLNSIAGTASLANGRWWMQNFNNKVIAFQNGQVPAVYTSGSGVLNSIVASSGVVPVSNGVGTAAFGRVWCVGTDNQTLNYSGLLDETDWGSASSGLIDMRTIWADGTDIITAVFHFNAALVVCGSKHVVMFTDGRGSMLGMDPTQAYVFDIILGSGCQSQWTVDYIGEQDVIFLSPSGVQSLSRLTTERSNPGTNLAKYVRSALLYAMQAEVAANITGVYNQLTGFYVLSFPVSGTIWCLDMKRRYNDSINENVCRITTWQMNATSMAMDHSNNLYIARTAGTVGLYTGNSDEGSAYIYTWLSPWMNLGENLGQRIKMLKRLSFLCYTAGAATITFNWNVDFGRVVQSSNITLPAFGVNSQYGIGQYGVAQYGGGLALVNLKYPAHARGQYYQIGVSTSVIGGFSVQQAQLVAKIGRIA